MIFRILSILIFLTSCNVIETLTDGETKLDEQFFNQEQNNDNSQNSSLFNGLVSFYNFNTANSTGYFNDIQGTNDLSTANSSSYSDAQTLATGQFGQAVNCAGMAGVTSFINPTTQGLSFGFTTDYSVSFWVQRLGADPGSGMGIILFDDFANFYIQDAATNENLYVDLRGSINFEVSTVLGSSGWNHVVLKVDRDTGYEICVNGSCGGYSANDSTGNAITPTIFRICGDSANLYAFNGQMDSLGFWSRLLTNDEVTELYNGVSGLDF